MEIPSLERCLAYAVLTDYRSWLGRPSLQDLDAFLAGAAVRAQLQSAHIPEWRIFGPLERPGFYLPLVARTGHPTLTIKWASALEFLHLDLELGVRELVVLLENWQRSLASASLPVELIAAWPQQPPPSLPSFLRILAARPGMFIGSNSGWALRCYLHGMARGGDWLELPPLPAIHDVIERIEAQSRGSYGSSFAAYRAYHSDLGPLLSWAGIEPL